MFRNFQKKIRGPGFLNLRYGTFVCEGVNVLCLYACVRVCISVCFKEPELACFVSRSPGAPSSAVASGDTGFHMDSSTEDESNVSGASVST